MVGKGTGLGMLPMGLGDVWAAVYAALLLLLLRALPSHCAQHLVLVGAAIRLLVVGAGSRQLHPMKGTAWQTTSTFCISRLTAG